MKTYKSLFQCAKSLWSVVVVVVVVIVQINLKTIKTQSISISRRCDSVEFQLNVFAVLYSKSLRVKSKELCLLFVSVIRRREEDDRLVSNYFFKSIIYYDLRFDCITGKLFWKWGITRNNLQFCSNGEDVEKNSCPVVFIYIYLCLSN